MSKEPKEFTVYRHYTYAEIYHVEAKTEKEAIEKLDDGLLSGEFDDPDDIFIEFDFYDAHES